jgi:hypothetical protein
MASRNASARAMSPSTWAASSGGPGAVAEASATRPAGLALPDAGLGAGAGMISGKRLAAFPAPMTVVLVASRPGMGPAMAAGSLVVKRLALFRLGRGTGGRFAARRDVPTGLAEPFGEALADGLGDAERVVLALAVGDAEPVGVAVGVGVSDVEGVGLALVVGVGADVDGEGEGDADVDVDGEGEGDADVDVDGLGVLEPPGPELVLAEEGDGEGVTTLANAGSCTTDSPETRKIPVTRPTTTARRCARETCEPPASAAGASWRVGM